MATSIIKKSLASNIYSSMFGHGVTKSIAFSYYEGSSALIICNAGRDTYGVFFYGNGYLSTIHSHESIIASLSADYKTVTITNNTSAANGGIAVFNFGPAPMTVSTS